MDCSAQEARQILSKWMQEKTPLSLLVSIDGATLSVLTQGEVATVELEPSGAFRFRVGESEFGFLLDDAKFEYDEPPAQRRGLTGLPPDSLSCLSIEFRDVLRKRSGSSDEATSTLVLCQQQI